MLFAKVMCRSNNGDHPALDQRSKARENSEAALHHPSVPFQIRRGDALDEIERVLNRDVVRIQRREARGILGMPDPTTRRPAREWCAAELRIREKRIRRRGSVSFRNDHLTG